MGFPFSIRLFPLFILWQITSGQNTTQQIHPSLGMPPCDVLVAAGFSDRLLLPTNDNYVTSVDTYWALNSRLQPWCILQPHNTKDVSNAVKALEKAGKGAGDWHIAVRSGGHGLQGVNNIDNGVTIDLSLMNHTHYDSKTELAHIEPGARWKNVYADLQRFNVTASGGRDGGVGVGGFLLGGGNTYYAGRTGLGCDTVVNFEVVLANGTVINANHTENPDLWRALKGGGSNFGIVTRFDVSTLPAQNLSYSLRTISTNYSDDFINALVGYTNASSDSPDDAIIAFYSHDPSIAESVMIVIEVNTRGETNSSIFDDFNRIPALESSQTVESLTQAAFGSQVADGTWNAQSTITFANDPRILQHAVALHDQFVATLSQRIGAGNFTTYTFFQPIPASFGAIGRAHGGNMLGLPRDQNVYIWTGGVAVTTSAHDLGFARTALRAISADLAAFSRSLRGGVDLVYMNYADTSQDPLGSYPAENIRLIREVAEKFDPEGFFQKRVPGGFKISRVE